MRHYSTILREEREKADLSRRAVAKVAGISEGHLRFLERGDRDTKPATLRKLALAIGIDERELMESWLKENMPAMDYSDLAARLPKGIDVAQLEEMYQIPEAKQILQEAELITASQFKNISASELFRIRGALRNCLGFIRELENNT
ncbi:Helix-turn-helix protein (plasmid) [Desulfocapsa sulfexigens DSM 10523]|uniref:Helix-turn-helix protein n=1 Tax=Desulfocapsa sulfexigens (strain DSM 10523 / SB164P1) TaxID=1167006 RepID=M1P9H4_DESSD|nr:helix-turn-helix transcriptional regulator [Desulfocapsa sulfexigens]AGF80103.1 Helix-turn-helix protein [Desulfocapsa sulfexigens DSM 10523]